MPIKIKRAARANWFTPRFQSRYSGEIILVRSSPTKINPAGKMTATENGTAKSNPYDKTPISSPLNKLRASEKLLRCETLTEGRRIIGASQERIGLYNFRCLA